MKKYFFILISATMISCSGTELITVKKQGVNFINKESLSEVIDLAKSQQKIVYVDFYTDWCTPCKMMIKDVYSDKGIADMMNENFVCYKVNAEKNNGPNLAFLYEVSTYPTLLFLDLNGRVLKRKNGAAYHTELTKMVNEVLGR